MNKMILKILLGVLGGISLGLYFQNIALFVYSFIAIFYVILKNNLQDILIFTFSILIFLCASFVDTKFENLYKEDEKFSGIGEIVSFAEEKNYKNKYIIKIKQIELKNSDSSKFKSKDYKNTKLIIYVDKNVNLEYGDIIYFKNCNFEKASTTRNDKCFDYGRYLRQSKIFGILDLENFKIISQNKGLRYKFFKFRNDLKESLYNLYNEENAGFLAAYMLRRYF